MTEHSAAIFLRVSTAQQARHDISIPDQRNQITAYAEERKIPITVEFVEAGVSARADHRPVFQEMISQALTKPPPFTRIIVHSMSRLFRDEMWYEWYRRKCHQNGVEFISITQDFGEGSGGDLTRRIMALTDEINSVENAKHVRRTMLENARQ
jgi:site-specific DNA recombinase